MLSSAGCPLSYEGGLFSHFFPLPLEGIKVYLTVYNIILIPISIWCLWLKIFTLLCKLYSSSLTWTLVLSCNIPWVHGWPHHSHQLVWQAPVPPWTWQMPSWHWWWSAHWLDWWPPHAAAQQFAWHAEPVQQNVFSTSSALIICSSVVEPMY
jgi:hypothetical protein